MKENPVGALCFPARRFSKKREGLQGPVDFQARLGLEADKPLDLDLSKYQEKIFFSMARRPQRVLTHALLATLVLMASFSGAAAQKGKSVIRRVNFPRGRTSTVLKGTVRRGISHDYLLRARAGQTMTLHLAAKAAGMSLTILKPDGETWIYDTKDWSGELPATGTYRINVLPDTTTERPTTYALEVMIR
jgi:hypothetical protein